MKKIIKGIFTGLFFSSILLLSLYIIFSFTLWKPMPISDEVLFIIRFTLITGIFAGIGAEYDK